MTSKHTKTPNKKSSHDGKNPAHGEGNLAKHAKHNRAKHDTGDEAIEHCKVVYDAPAVGVGEARMKEEVGEEVQVETLPAEGQDYMVDLSDDFNRIFTTTTFNSFQEFEELFTRFKEETGSVFRIKSSCSVPYENARRKKHLIPLRFKFVSVKYCCVHYGQPKISGQGIRSKQRYLPCGCNCVVAVAYNRGALMLTQVVMLHNHEVSSKMAPYYAINRRISNAELRKVADVINLLPSSRAVQQFLLEHFQRPTTLQDAKNIRSKVKMLQMRPEVNEEEAATCEAENGRYDRDEEEDAVSGIEVQEPPTVIIKTEQIESAISSSVTESDTHLDANTRENILRQVSDKINSLVNSCEPKMFMERIAVLNKIFECWENGDEFEMYDSNVPVNENNSIENHNIEPNISLEKNTPVNINILGIPKTQTNTIPSSPRNEGRNDTPAKRRPGRPRKYPRIDEEATPPKPRTDAQPHSIQPVVLSIKRDNHIDEVDSVEIEINGDVVRVKRSKLDNDFAGFEPKNTLL